MKRLLALFSLLVVPWCILASSYDDAFFIVNSETGLVLDISRASRKRGTPVIMYRRKTTQSESVDNQLWRYNATSKVITSVMKGEDGKYLALDVLDGCGGNRAIVWTQHGRTNQQWTFDSDTGELQSKCSKRIAMEHDRLENGGAVVLRSRDSTLGRFERWKMVPYGSSDSAFEPVIMPSLPPLPALPPPYVAPPLPYAVPLPQRSLLAQKHRSFFIKSVLGNLVLQASGRAYSPVIAVPHNAHGNDNAQLWLYDTQTGNIVNLGAALVLEAQTRSDGSNFMDLMLHESVPTNPMQSFVFDPSGEIRLDKTMHVMTLPSRSVLGTMPVLGVATQQVADAALKGWRTLPYNAPASHFGMLCAVPESSVLYRKPPRHYESGIEECSPSSDLLGKMTDRDVQVAQ